MATNVNIRPAATARRSGEWLQDPEFLRLLRRRNRLRWTLAGLLTVAYFAYGVAGLYVPQVFATPLGGSGISLGVVLGYGIILLGIASSIFYVWQVNRLIAPLERRLSGEA